MEIGSCSAESSVEVRGVSQPEALLVDVSVGFSAHIIEPPPPPPPENDEGQFSVSELVWGKVKSHPWWPGQIFDSRDASQRAIKCKKKDTFLVAYFGDQTFAWNNASSLKHFESHFSLMEKQSNSQPFCAAVDSALNELGTRLVLGMLCPCAPNRLLKSSHPFHNAGIRTPAASSPPAPDSKPSFHPAKLLNLLKALATNPLAPPDRLQLKIAHSQLMVFFCLKGYSQLPQFHVYGGLLDDDPQYLNPPSNQKRSLPDLLAGTKLTSALHHRASSKSITSSGRRKRMAVASSCQGFKGMSSIPTDSPAPAPQSFKVGECIRRIASQLTGSPPILKCSAQKFQLDQNEGTDNPHTSLIVPHQCSSPDVMLSQLCLAARDPMKGYSFLSVLVDFFSDFRNSISLERATSLKQNKIGHRIRKQCNTNNISKETFDFEEMSDTYWTDMVIQSSSEEQPPHRSRKRKQISDFVLPTELDGSSYEDEDPLQLSLVLDFQGKNDEDDDDDYLYANDRPSRKSCKKKKNSRNMLPLDKRAVVAEKTKHRLNDSKYGNDFSPTALIMSFMEPDSVPSEMNLNKIFRRFGPLKESETKVLRDTGRATVIFKKQSDAEVAFSSAAKFSIFGPVRVSYQLRFQV